MLTKTIRRFAVGTLLLLIASLGHAREDLSAHWEGEWIVEGTLFRIAVAVENDELVVTQIESLGFLWTSENGEIDGNVVRVAVEYAGVTGTIQAELIDPNTAVAFAASCLPDFMVVCMLSKDRQAVFRKVSDSGTDAGNL